MIEYTKAKTEDFEDLIDFINMVFSQAGGSTSFRDLLPKLYGRDKDTSGCHYIARENGRIKAVVGVFPTDMYVGGTLFKVGHVGSVSVHPESRGRGYMKKLMGEALKDAKKEGLDGLALSGLKNRYQYFGFMPTETVVKYTFLPENVRHLLKNTDVSAISFEKIHSADSGYVEEMKALYETCPVYTDRVDTAYFYDVLCSWNGSVYAILKEGCFAGYMSASRDNGYIYEYMLKDMEDFPLVLKAWFEEKHPANLAASCGVFEREKCEIMGKYCEAFYGKTGHSWNILNMEKFITAWMKVKNEYEELEPGALTLKITDEDGTQEVCSLRVEGGEDCKKTVEISRKDAIEALFSEAAYYRSYGEAGTLKYKNWFPLPLFLGEPDAC